MLGMRSLLVLLLVVGCAASGSEAASEIGTEAPAPETFGTSDARLQVALKAAVAEWNNAACLGLVVSNDAPDHTFAFSDASSIRPGRTAETMGVWSDTRTRILDDSAEDVPWHYSEQLLQNMVAHEMGHILGRTNDHAADGVDGPGIPYDGRVTESSLSKVCEQRDCGCFNVSE